MESFVNDKDFDLLAQDQYTFAVLDRILRGRCDLVRTNHQDLIMCHSEEHYPVWFWTPDGCADEMKEKAWELANSSGTNWSFFKHIANEYSFGNYLKSSSVSDLKHCLDTGGYIVASMGKGYWTNGGHYICVWKYDDTYIYANDPASSKRTKQKISDFMKERKAFFCFWK